jgi:streptogramin lyase
VSRIDLRTLETRTVGLPARPGWSALGAGALWIAHPLRGSASRLPTKELVVRDEIDLTPPGGAQPFVYGLAVGAGSVWAVTETLGQEGLSRIDPETLEVVARIPLGPSSEAGGIVAVGAGAVWVTGVEGYVVRVDPATNRVVARIPVAGNTWVAVGSGAVWVTVNRESTVWKIDPATNLAIRSITVGEGPRTVEVGAGSVWVASFRSGTVARVDPETDRVVKTVRLTPPARGQNTRGPAGIAIEHERVWVTVPRVFQFE